MVVLDTDHLSTLTWDTDQARRLRMRLASLPPDAAATTIITFEEQMRGRLAYVARARTLADQVEAYRRLRTQLDNYQLIPVLDFTERAAAEFQRLRQLRVRVGAMDLKIAAIVLVNGATLLSCNLVDFGKIPGLFVENWLTSP